MRKFIFIITYPLRLLFLGLVYFYKFFIDPVIPKVCRFTPTCSTYMVQSIKEFGPIRGAWIGTKRLFRCRPGIKGGFDPIPPNIKGELKWLL